MINFVEGDGDITYSCSRHTWQDILASLPQGWIPHYALFWNYEYYAVPAGLQDSPCPVIGIIGDWNLCFETVKQTAHIFDYLFTDRQGVDVLKYHGIKNVDYLPIFSFNPHQHRAMPDVENIYDILFIGNLNHAVQRERSKWLYRLSMLSNKYKVKILTGIFGDEYTKVMNQAKIVFNRSIRGEMNMRAYEATACGSLLFMEDTNLEVQDFLTDRVECVLYDETNFEDLLEYYLTHDEERERISRNGLKKIQQYRHAYHIKILTEKIEALGLPRKVRNSICIPVSEKIRRHCSMASQAYLSSLTRDKFEFAEMELEKAEQLDPHNPEILNNRGVVYAGYASNLKDMVMKMEFYGYAEEYFKKAISHIGNYAVANYNLANLYLNMGGIEKGETVLKEVVEMLKDDLLAATLTMGLFTSLAYNWFRIERERISFVYSGSDYQEAIGHLLLCKSLETLGDIAIYHNLPGTALNAYEEASAIKPENSLLHYKCAQILSHMGEPYKAVEKLRGAISIDPFSFDARIMMTQLLAGLGMFEEHSRIVIESLKMIEACPSYGNYKHRFEGNKCLTDH